MIKDALRKLTATYKTILMLLGKSAFLGKRAILQLNAFFARGFSFTAHFRFRARAVQQSAMETDAANQQHILPSEVRCKPPDILVCNFSEQRAQRLQSNDITALVKACAVPDGYTVYEVSAKQIYDRSALSLSENTVLLTILNLLSNQHVQFEKQLANYFASRGRILLLNESDGDLPKFVTETGLQYDKKFICEQQVEVWKQPEEADAKTRARTKTGLIVRAQCGESFLKDPVMMKTLLNLCEIETIQKTDGQDRIAEEQQPTPSALLYLRNMRSEPDLIQLDSICNFLRRPFLLDVHARTHVSRELRATSESSRSQFDVEAYLDALGTKRLGQVCVYAPRLGTTMTVFDSLIPAFYRTRRRELSNADVDEPDWSLRCALQRFGLTGSSFVAVADRQTSGVGRGNNQWLSPPGQLAFTLLVELDRKGDAFLYGRLAIMQHLVALAFVDALHKLVAQQHGSAETLERVRAAVRIKWPNDIYFVCDTSKTKVKLGGVLVKSSLFSDVAFVLIGVGLNVDNDKPTVSLNSVLRAIGAQSVSREQLLASFNNRFEAFVSRFASLQPAFIGESESERKAMYEFRESYYASWLHTAQRVTVVQNDGRSVQADVVGIDSFGFLLAREESSGEVLSLQPDGNSFDLLENLIRTKQ